MSPEQMRKAIKARYDSPKWAAKIDKMPDKQVYAIYTRMLSRKEI